MNRFFLVSLSAFVIVGLSACQQSNNEPLRTPVANYSHIGGGNNAVGQQVPAGNSKMQPLMMEQSSPMQSSGMQPSPMGMTPPSSIKEMESLSREIDPMDEIPENPTYEDHNSVFAFPNLFKSKKAPTIQKRRPIGHPEYVEAPKQPAFVKPTVSSMKRIEAPVVEEKSVVISSDAEKYKPVKPISLAPIKSDTDLEREKQLAKMKLERQRKIELAKKELARKEFERKEQAIKEVEKQKAMERKEFARKEQARKKTLLKERKKSTIDAIYQEEKTANEEIKRRNTNLLKQSPLDTVVIGNNEVAGDNSEYKFIGEDEGKKVFVKKEKRQAYLKSSRYSDRENSLSGLNRH